MMRTLRISSTLITIVYTSAVLGDFFRSELSNFLPITFRTHQQRPIMNIPNIALPPFTHSDKDSSSKSPDENNCDKQVIITDVIAKQRAINVFAGLAGDIDSISRRLNDHTQNTTVLAPLNSQVEELPRKPWEDPRDYEALGANAYEGQGGDERAQRNLRRFVEAHIIPVSPWKEGEKVESLGGETVWWEEKAGRKLVRWCSWCGRSV